MKTLSTIEDRILQRINVEIGNDFKKLHRAAIIAEDYETRLKNIANKVKNVYKKYKLYKKHVEWRLSLFLCFSSVTTKKIILQVLKPPSNIRSRQAKALIFKLRN